MSDDWLSGGAARRASGPPDGEPGQQPDPDATRPVPRQPEPDETRVMPTVSRPGSRPGARPGEANPGSSGQGVTTPVPPPRTTPRPGGGIRDGVRRGLALVP